MPKKFQFLLYILAFIEGGAVMCVELCSAKILTPYFGTSIYVWASVLGVTLTALMSGYYLGGYLSTKRKGKAIIFWLMLIGGLWITLTPVISAIILPLTIELSIATGSILSLLLILFFPLLCFGATSPLLINLLTRNAQESGKSSGTVYAVSTLGGIVITFVIGFYALPQHGISQTLYAYGLLIMGYTTYLFVHAKLFKTSVSLVLIAGMMSLNFYSGKSEQVKYFSEGILGEVKVVDRALYDDHTKQSKVYRQLVVNNISQTIMDLDNPEVSYWDYVNVLTQALEIHAQGKNTLLLGLGGGTLFKNLVKGGFETEVVEIDARIAEVAKEFFFINPELNVIVDDARHYLNKSTKQYDVVIYDLFQAETPPSHLMTQEAFGKLKKNLTTDGILVINFYGFIEGKRGQAARSIYQTLRTSGYHVNLIATAQKESERNLLFFCSLSDLPNLPEKFHTLSEKEIMDDESPILTDNQPLLEHLYAEAALSWRIAYNQFNTKYFITQQHGKN